MMISKNSTKHKILKALESKNFDRDTLVLKLRIARTTIFDNLFIMLMNKMVWKQPIYDGSRGRPKVMWLITEKGLQTLREIENGNI